MLIDGVFHSEGSGYMPSASNNDAELQASLQGLIAAYRFVHKPVNILGLLEPVEVVPPTVTLVADSQLVLGWVSGKFKFKQADKMEKFNQINALMRRMNVQTRWVRGHSGNVFNERCDKLANAARLQIPVDQPKSAKHRKTRIGLRTEGVIAISLDGQIKVLDKNKNIVEDWNLDLHGNREIKKYE